MELPHKSRPRCVQSKTSSVHLERRAANPARSAGSGLAQRPGAQRSASLVPDHSFESVAKAARNAARSTCRGFRVYYDHPILSPGTAGRVFFLRRRVWRRRRNAGLGRGLRRRNRKLRGRANSESGNRFNFRPGPMRETVVAHANSTVRPRDRRTILVIQSHQVVCADAIQGRLAGGFNGN